MDIQAKGLDYRALNEAIRAAGPSCRITGCLGQRFIGAGMSGRRVEIDGIPGNALGAYLGHMFSGAFADGTTAYLLRCDWLLLVLGIIGCTSLPKRLWEKREQALSPALSDGLRTVWVVVVLLVSMAFLVGDSYNPFLYFRF